MKVNENLKKYSINELKNIHIYGRTGSQKMPLPLFWTASGVELNVTGSELWIELEADYEMHEPWISIEINGAWIARQMITAGKHNICIFRNMDPQTAKKIRIFRDVQAMSDDGLLYLHISGFQSDGEFLPVPKKERKIEIIGDSITSGEGSIGAQEELDWISMWFTALNDYAVMTADKVNADFRLVSQSGWGVVSSWDNNPNCALPDYYEQVCGVCKGDVNEKAGAKEVNDFSSWQPDYIIVNLGTNDDGAFHNVEWTNPETGEVFEQRMTLENTYLDEDLRRFIEKAKNFLKKLRKNNPNAYIFWAFGMLGAELFPAIQTAVKEYTEEAGDKNVEAVLLPQAEGEGVGARSHPGVINHRQAAEILSKKIMEKEA